MATVNTTDISALISFAVLNNRNGLIKAVNDFGFITSSTITDGELLDIVYQIFTNTGVIGLKNLLSRVRLDSSKTNGTEALALNAKFEGKPISDTSKINWQNLFQNIGDFLGGSTDVVQTPNVVTVEPTVKPGIVIGLAIAGIIGIIVLIFFLKK